MFTPDVVYLRWVNIDTKVLGTLLFLVVCLTRRNERHLVIFFKSSPGNVKKKSDYIGAKFYYQKCLSFRPVSFFQGYRLCISAGVCSPNLGMIPSAPEAATELRARTRSISLGLAESHCSMGLGTTTSRWVSLLLLPRCASGFRIRQPA